MFYMCFVCIFLPVYFCSNSNKIQVSLFQFQKTLLKFFLYCLNICIFVNFPKINLFTFLSFHIEDLSPKVFGSKKKDIVL